MVKLREVIPFLHYSAFFVAAFYVYHWRPYLNKALGFNAEILHVDRTKIGLPELPLLWQVNEDPAKLAANQFWFNSEIKTVPRHYAKHTQTQGRGGRLLIERDMYLYELGDSTAGIVEIEYAFDKARRGADPWSCRQYEYRFEDREDPTGYIHGKWKKPRELRKLGLAGALEFLESKGFQGLPYRNSPKLGLIPGPPKLESIASISPLQP